MIKGFHHVQLACPSGAEDAVRRFYGDVLGMTEVSKPPALAARGGLWFRSGAAELHFGVEEGFRPARKAHPGLVVDDSALTALAGRIEAAGYQVAWDENLPGHRRFHAFDPLGNRLEFLAAARPGR